MSKQELIELCTTEDGKGRKYIGRFLGFIKDDEFNALVQNTDQVATRLESKATLSIMEIAAMFDNMAGHRLIMTVRKIDDKSVAKKTLYVTEGLTMINSVSPRTKEDKEKKTKASPGKVTFQAGENENIVVQETE
jgi:hypothetical protein